MINLFDVKTDNVTDYEETSMLLVFPKCSGKCGPACHNYNMIGKTAPLNVKVEDIVNLYNSLSDHKAVVCAGLEPFDSFDDLYALVEAFANNSKPCDFVIYSGYYPYNDVSYENSTGITNVWELARKIVKIKGSNQDFTLYFKYGRYIEDPNDDGYDSRLLGVHLSSRNQTVSAFMNGEEVGSENRNNIYIADSLLKKGKCKNV